MESFLRAPEPEGQCFFAAEAVIYEIDHFNGFLYAVIQQRGNILGVCGLVVPGQEPFVYGLRSDNRYRGVMRP